jgi:hypothetical protein
MAFVQSRRGACEGLAAFAWRSAPTVPQRNQPLVPLGDR